MDRLWDRTLEVLKGSVDSKNFAAWIAPLRQARATKSHLHLIAPNKTARKWFIDHYLAQATETLR